MIFDLIDILLHELNVAMRPKFLNANYGIVMI